MEGSFELAMPSMNHNIYSDSRAEVVFQWKTFVFLYGVQYHSKENIARFL